MTSRLLTFRNSVFLPVMKIKLFLVSFFILALSVEGASIEKKDGVVTIEAAGQVIKMGYTERSGIFVKNPYPELQMKVHLQIYELTPNAYYGYGRDPLLGTPPKRIMHNEETYYWDGSKDFFAPSPGIVLDRGRVLVTVTWFDMSGKQKHRPASIIIAPGGADIWVYGWWPSPGQCSNQW